FETVDLKKPQVAMIILDAFLLQFRTLLRGKLVSLTLLFGPGRTPLMIFQERFAIVWTPPVGSACHFHLQHAEINAQLQFFATVESGDFAHFDRATLI